MSLEGGVLRVESVEKRVGAWGPRNGTAVLFGAMRRRAAAGSPPPPPPLFFNVLASLRKIVR